MTERPNKGIVSKRTPDSNPALRRGGERVGAGRAEGQPGLVLVILARRREGRVRYSRLIVSAGIEVIDIYRDATVKGGDPIHERPGFADMLESIEGNGAILVERASRFARDLIVQETGYAMLKARGIDLITVDSPTSFLDETPTAKLIRQILDDRFHEICGDGTGCLLRDSSFAES